MVTLIDVADELVLPLGDTVFETVLAVLVIYAFHGRVREHLIRLADFDEYLVRLGFLVAWASHRVVLESQAAVSVSDLLTIGS